MLFKNPYINEGDTYYLSNPERKFLKKALFLFAQGYWQQKKKYSDYYQTSNYSQR